MPGTQFNDGSSSGIDPLGPSLLDIFLKISDYAVWGDTENGYGVVGTSRTGPGVFGKSSGDTVQGKSGTKYPGTGVLGTSTNGIGVVGIIEENPFNGGVGVYGEVNLESGIGVRGSTNGVSGVGVAGMNTTYGTGVIGDSYYGTGVFGRSTTGYGVRGEGEDIGVYAHNTTALLPPSGKDPRPVGNDVYLATRGLAGDFYGDVYVYGYLSKAGGGFTVDHPLDNANKYLCHSFVESSDMKNIYDGVVGLNAKGEAVVNVPAWFEALNKDFRYQLTPIGAPGPNLYIAEGITKNSFKIAGGKPRSKVSWQVTGIRKDAWANAHRIRVEEKKPSKERGYYLHPELYGKPAKKGIEWARYPEQIKQRKLLEENKTRMEKLLKRKPPVR